MGFTLADALNQSQEQYHLKLPVFRSSHHESLEVYKVVI